ncbi:MAG TPA: hypothetical protein VIM12_15420 [Noviherbaspirillum sp.]|uniref:hypothetical protein n=1 Tax=Noviherbaspirillum sp. TaxID=1926288 RepID=UPI002F947FE3
MPTLLRNIEKLLGVWDDPGKSPNERNAALRAFKKYHGHLFRYATEDDSQIVAALRPIKRRLDDGGLQQCPPGELKRMPLTHGRIPD